MKKQFVASAILIILPILMVSCVSSLLKENPPKFSKEVQWSEPKKPFEKIDTPVYPAWKNKVTGNVISIVSDCGNSSQVGLLALHQLIESSVEEFKLIKEEKIIFQDKTALVHFSQGELDGAPIEIQSLSFRRKDCGYLTALSGKRNNLEDDRKKFELFNESLRF